MMFAKTQAIISLTLCFACILTYENKVTKEHSAVRNCNSDTSLKEQLRKFPYRFQDWITHQANTEPSLWLLPLVQVTVSTISLHSHLRIWSRHLPIQQIHHKFHQSSRLQIRIQFPCIQIPKVFCIL